MCIAYEYLYVGPPSLIFFVFTKNGKSSFKRIAKCCDAYIPIYKKSPFNLPVAMISEHKTKDLTEMTIYTINIVTNS